MRWEILQELDRKETEELWDVGVCMDDWDYVVVSDPLPEDEAVPYVPGFSLRLELDDLCAAPALTGCCYNTWYLVRFRGAVRVVGVAYHA